MEESPGQKHPNHRESFLKGFLTKSILQIDGTSPDQLKMSMVARIDESYATHNIGPTTTREMAADPFSLTVLPTTDSSRPMNYIMTQRRSS